jgi:hypothetical protein
MQEGFIARPARGRIATQRAYTHPGSHSPRDVALMLNNWDDGYKDEAWLRICGLDCRARCPHSRRYRDTESRAYSSASAGPYICFADAVRRARRRDSL